jgi:hypothetical protein
MMTNPEPNPPRPRFSPDREPPQQLFDQLYDELRSIAGRYMARERANHTLQPTALVNEAFIRLAKSGAVKVSDRAHFLRAKRTRPGAVVTSLTSRFPMESAVRQLHSISLPSASDSTSCRN